MCLIEHIIITNSFGSEIKGFFRKGGLGTDT